MNKQRGFSLLGVMIVVAVIGVMAVIILSVVANQRAAREHIGGRHSLSMLEQAVRTDLWESTFPVFAEAAAACPGVVTIQGDLDRLLRDPEADYVKRYKVEGTPGTSERCSLKYLDTDGVKSSGITFCLTVEPTQTYAKLIDGPIHAEVKVGLVDLLSGKAIECRSFFGESLPRMAGLRIQYELTWKPKGDGTAPLRRIEDVYHARAN